VAAATAMMLAMGLMSLGGVYAYQRGSQAVVEARDELISRKIPRAEIDAGYSLNGEDLYRYPAGRIDEQSDEQGIPMITAGNLSLYTVAAAPLPETRVVERFWWPGPFGTGQRPLYVLRSN
jgi:hypothetical protein